MFNSLIENIMEIYVICESGELMYPIGFRTKEQAEETIKTSENRGLYVDKIKVVDKIIDLDTMYP